MMILDMFNLKGKVAVVTGANTVLGQGMTFLQQSLYRESLMRHSLHMAGLISLLTMQDLSRE